jgi:plastocyanin
MEDNATRSHRLERPRGALALLALVALSVALPLSFACGGGDDKTSTGGETPGTGIYDVTMTDTGNTPNDYIVAVGSTLTLNFTNNGVAAHNVRVAGEDNEYNTGDDAVSDPDLIIGGGKGKLTWKAPSKAGEYIFRCDFHTDLKGTITVK